MQAKYLIGTLFEQEQLNKKMNAQNIKNKDPMGNVRWKGAFTGGFEAGYKNTCGSKDGWTPSSFVATVGGTRGERVDKSIFDYMDKQDLGREQIGQNIKIKNMGKSEVNSQANPFKIKQMESIGDTIIAQMKRKMAFVDAPENVQDLGKLLQKYQHQEKLSIQNEKYHLKGLQGFNSVGAEENIPDDQFIVAYDDFFKRVIRAGVKEETEEQAEKRRNQNKIYFDFTKPLQEEPEYLKEIQEVQQFAKPKKRRKNVINDHNLKDLFKISSQRIKQFSNSKFVDDVPADYDPFHRVKNMKDKQKQFLVSADQKKRQKVYSMNQRSDLLNEGRLSNRFVAAGSNSNKFVRSGQQAISKQNQKYFEDESKNKRYQDYVLELEGKKISAQLEYLSYEEAQKQKQEFEKLYNERQAAEAKAKQNIKKLPTKIQEALKAQNKKQIKVIRKTGSWRPQKLLCKRFGCMLPYKQQSNSNKNDEDGSKQYF